MSGSVKLVGFFFLRRNLSRSAGHSLDVLEVTTTTDGFGKVTYGKERRSALCVHNRVEQVEQRRKDQREGDRLVGSSIRFMAPATQAADLRTMNSNPSLETRVT